ASNPVGHYFNALYETGVYYEFIGWAQLTAAILLLIPRFSHLGALLFFLLIANIALLTTSVGFVGAGLITTVMSWATPELVAWEYDRVKQIVVWTREARTRKFKFQYLAIPGFFAAGGVAMGMIWWWIRLGNFSNYLNITAGLVVLGAIFGSVVAVHYRFMPA